MFARKHALCRKSPNTPACLPDVPDWEDYHNRIPDTLKPESYSLKLRLFDQINTQRAINLTWVDSIKVDQGFFQDGT